MDDDDSDFDPRDFYSQRHIDNLSRGANDQVFIYLYRYYVSEGYVTFCMSSLASFCGLTFCLLASGFFYFCINFSLLSKLASVERDSKDFGQYLYPQCRPDGGRGFWASLVFTIYVLALFARARQIIHEIRIMRTVHRLWIDKLTLPRDPRWVPSWSDVVEAFKNKVDSSIDEMVVATRIMRWENYQIAILINDLFQFSSFSRVAEYYLYYTATDVLFSGDREMVREDLLANRTKQVEYELLLERTLFWYGVFGLLLSPLLCLGMVIYFFFKYISEMYKNPESFGFYRFTPLAKLKLRDFNELSHVYSIRLNKAHGKVLDFLDQFVNRPLIIVTDFLAFVCGSVGLLLTAISLLNSTVYIFAKPIYYWIALLGTAYYILAGDKTKKPLVFEPDAKFDELDDILQFSHSASHNWSVMTIREKYDEIKKYFKLHWVVFLEEIVSLIYVPAYMLIKRRQLATTLVAFFRQNTVSIDGLGTICSYAWFRNLNSHKLPTNKVRLGSGSGTDQLEREVKRETEDPLIKKMSASVQQFQINNPYWSTGLQLEEGRDEGSTKEPPQMSASVQHFQANNFNSTQNSNPNPYWLNGELFQK